MALWPGRARRRVLFSPTQSPRPRQTVVSALVLPIGVAKPNTPDQNNDFCARSKSRSLFRAPPPQRYSFPRAPVSARASEKYAILARSRTHFPKRNQQHINREVIWASATRAHGHTALGGGESSALRRVGVGFQHDLLSIKMTGGTRTGTSRLAGGVGTRGHIWAPASLGPLRTPGVKKDHQSVQVLTHHYSPNCACGKRL